jgi:hypothetical protein
MRVWTNRYIDTMEFISVYATKKFIDIGTPISYKEAESFFMNNGGERLAQTINENKK